jgi:hypothetical protein
MIQPRPYQIAVVEAVIAAHARGVRRPLVCVPTGTGKTIAFGLLLQQRGGPGIRCRPRKPCRRAWGCGGGRSSRATRGHGEYHRYQHPRRPKRPLALGAAGAHRKTVDDA